MSNIFYKNLDPRLVMPYWTEFLEKLDYKLISSHDSATPLHWNWYTHEKTLWKVGLKSNFNYGDKTNRLDLFIFYNNLSDNFFPLAPFSFNLKIELELSIKALIHPNLLPLCLNFPWLQEVIQHTMENSRCQLPDH